MKNKYFLLQTLLRLSCNRVMCFVCILLFIGSAKGSESSEMAEEERIIMEALNKQIRFYDSVLFHFVMDGLVTPLLPAEKWTNDSTIDSYLSEISKAEIESLKWKTGLEFNASYNYNTNMEAPDFEDGSGLYYKNRIQAGLNWNILNAGFVGKNNFIQEAHLKSKLRSLNTGKDALSIQYSFEIHKLNKTRNLVLGSLIKSQNLLFQQTSHIAEKLFKLGLLKYDEYIQFENKTKSLEHLAKKFNTDSIVIYRESVFYNVFSYYLIVPDSLFFYMQKSNRDILKAKTNIELHEILAKRDYYTQKMNISPYVRYQFLDYKEYRNSGHNINAGVQIGIPLSFEHKKEKKKNLLEADLSRYLLNEETEHLKYLLDEFMQRYNQKLSEVQKQIINISSKKKKVLQERIRFFTQQLPNNGKEYVLALDDYFSNIIVLFDKWFALRETFYEAQYLAGGEPPTHYAIAHNFDSEFGYSQDSPALSLRLTDSTKQQDMEQVAHACWLFFKRDIFVKYDPKIPMGKFRQFFRTAHRYSVNPYLCIQSKDVKSFIDTENKTTSLKDSLPSLRGVLLRISKEDFSMSDKIYWEILGTQLRENNASLLLSFPESAPADLFDDLNPFCDEFILEMKLNDHSDAEQILVDFLSHHPGIKKEAKFSVFIEVESIPLNFSKIVRQAIASEYTEQVIVDDFTSFHNLVYYTPKLGELHRGEKKSYYIDLSFFASANDAITFNKRISNTYPYSISHQTAFRYSMRIEDIPNKEEQQALLKKILHSRIIFY